MYLRYFLPLDEVRSASSGLTIAREYFPLRGRGRRVHEAEVGDIIQVKLHHHHAERPSHYLVVKIAAPGCEALDASSTTAPLSARAAPGNPRMGKELPDVALLGDDAARREGGALRQLPTTGIYEYTYLIRAGVTREFRVIPSRRTMYFPEVFGHSDGTIFAVR